MTIDRVYNFKLPDVGEGIFEAEIVRWLVNVGDTVGLNQPILEIQTDKAVVEIPAPVAGTVSAIKAESGELVHVGDVLIVIQESGVREQGAGSREQETNRDKQSVRPSPLSFHPSTRVLAAPAVRKKARELGIELAQVAGSGPGGRVLMDDVSRFAEQEQQLPTVLPTPTAEPAIKKTPVLLPRPAAVENSSEEPLQGLRRSMARRMELAWRTIPHVTVLEEIDATNLINLRKHLQPEAEQRGVRLTYLPFIIKATVQALKEFPYFNASLDMERQVITTHRHYHLGIATAVDDGLLVPVLRHANRLSVQQIAVELARLADAARQRKLGPTELSGSTFTITNFGSFGTAQGTPIINPPEVAVLGCGKIADKPVAVLGQLEVRPVLPLALSFDHRLLDGAAAGQFMGRLKTLLANPNLLFLELV